MRRAVAFDPRRTIDGRTPIIFVPAVGHPLINPAAHVIKTEGVGFETACFGGMRRVVALAAPLAVGHAALYVLAPPIAGLRAAPRGVFPFSLAQQPEPAVCALSKPRHELLSILPAQIGRGLLILAHWHRGAGLGGNALVP